jgi:uncharacterized membrane protein
MQIGRINPNLFSSILLFLQSIPIETFNVLNRDVCPSTRTYRGGWVSGVIFLVLEEKNKDVRFHAAQSIVLFGSLNILSMLLGWIPRAGGIFSALILAFSFIFWVVLMVKAYQGEMYKLPIAGDIAEGLARWNRPSGQTDNSIFIQPSHPGAASGDSGRGAVERTARREGTRTGRITFSAFAIAWSVVLLIVFNFFYRYIAYYDGETVDGVTAWTRFPLFTQDIHLWLPILTLTLILTVIGHITLIIFDKYILRELTLMMLDIFGLATVLTLLLIFPFDFSVISDSTAADMTGVTVTVVLILIAVGMSVGVLVRLIKLIVRLVSGNARY